MGREFRRTPLRLRGGGGGTINSSDLKPFTDLFYRNLGYKTETNINFLDRIGFDTWEALDKLAKHASEMCHFLDNYDTKLFMELRGKFESIVLLLVIASMRPLMGFFIDEFIEKYNRMSEDIRRKHEHARYQAMIRKAEKQAAAKAKREAKKQKAAEESAKTAAEEGESK